MASFLHRLALGALLLPVTLAVLAASPRASQPISVDAKSSDFDYKNGVLVFTAVRITQGDATVEAEHATATGLEFQNSSWHLQGNVRINAEGGSLSSDAATVRFTNNEIAGAEVTGAPASFTQQHDERLAQGHAQHIDYDLANGQVKLTGDAWLSDGSNEITGSTLVYSMREQRVVAEAAEQGGKPVHITINPKAPPGDSDKKSPPKTPSPQAAGSLPEAGK